MYAMIEEFGGQRRVTVNDVIEVDLVSGGEAAVGHKIKFDKVMIVGKEGGSAKIGQPYVAGASVEAEVIDPMTMGDKVHIYKYRQKKTWKKKYGHRQRYTTLKITAING
ncbi:MAG: 50S ribosomal protein L21 [Tepidisphaera sp.]|jgi:large subunit ribosomal protein L21